MCTTPDSQDFETALALIYDEAVKVTNQMMKDGV
jgi:hypothetical protein